MPTPAFSYDDYMRLYGGGANPLARQGPNFAGMPQFQYQTPQIQGQMAQHYNNGVTGMITPQLQYAQGGSAHAYSNSQGLGGGNAAAAYYNSNPNNSASAQMMHDIGVQAKNPSAQNFLGSFGQVADAVQSYKGWKYARGQDAEAQHRAQIAQAAYTNQAPTNWLLQNMGGSQTAQAAISREGTGNQLRPEEVQAMLDNEQQANARGQQTQQVNDFFASPDRAQQQDAYIQHTLGAQTADINHQFDMGLTKTVQGTAAQGLRGGSVDQERQADVGRAHDNAILGAGQQAQQSRQQMTAQDQALKEHLLSVINAGDPAQRDAAASRLQAIEDQAAGLGQQNQIDQQGQDISQQYRNNQSQALGSGISSASSFLQANPNRGSAQWWGAGSSGTGG